MEDSCERRFRVVDPKGEDNGGSWDIEGTAEGTGEGGIVDSSKTAARFFVEWLPSSVSVLG